LKNPPAAKKPTVQAVQHVQTVQVVESFYGSEMVPIPMSALKLSKISKPLLKQFCEIASDLGTKVAYGEDESG
jgi:hypothetical protein